jgi:hypothetical protein
MSFITIKGRNFLKDTFINNYGQNEICVILDNFSLILNLYCFSFYCYCGGNMAGGMYMFGMQNSVTTECGSFS